MEMRTVLEAVGKVARTELAHMGKDRMYWYTRVRLSPRAWSTNHRYDQATETHVLTFGGKMVSLHLGCTGRDRVIEEMERFGWGDRLGWSVASELACVILHEIAHIVTCREGGRRYRSVHNDHFYRNLRSMVDERAEFLTLELGELLGGDVLSERSPISRKEMRLDMESTAIRRALCFSNPQAITPYHTVNFRKGMRVQFTLSTTGEVIEGIIDRRGKKRWTVVAGGRRWYVPESMLRKA